MNASIEYRGLDYDIELVGGSIEWQCLTHKDSNGKKTPGAVFISPLLLVAKHLPEELTVRGPVDGDVYFTAERLDGRLSTYRLRRVEVLDFDVHLVHAAIILKCGEIGID
jgi:hypothetical protein